ncbi:acidobacterial duplicated orphan permease [Bhargavaea cecembensis DSE10]|uniref:Putative hemin transport system permease protein HrtB n=1 Tax=Bhargavaea cecembensis DSE10 TaxID=1235279 RepID=M7NHY3_9BACL|nr:ABC transporter permease [Bhargavaea cecembensis]EMR06847.1 acidobacterial duplicated orphan permease [Bhargavaea cecembensis DSE10]
MFLAWREIRQNKLRFALVTAVLLLVSYLVFFLSGLASGLAGLNREAVDKWQADGIYLTDESDKSLTQSMMEADLADEVEADEAAVLAQTNLIADNGDVKSGVALFGIRPDEFIMPEPTEGNGFSEEFEVIASDSLKEEGFSIGDELDLSGSEETLTITGFTDEARFNAAPVLYMNLDDFEKVRPGAAALAQQDEIAGQEEQSGMVNAIVVRGAQPGDVPEDLEYMESETFIENLPGYTEQNLTLTFMIYFLFAISAAVVAIFLYVLTVQKISMFGVMKAQGISSAYLSRSVIAQTFILAVIGVLIGFGLTVLTGQFLPAAVPVSFDYGMMAIYGAVLIVVAILGALVSVWTIVKIDPLEAISG